MAEIDAKVNMSLDEIIKMEKKKKAGALNGKAGNAKRNRGNGARGRAGFRGRGNARVKRNIGTVAKKQQTWQRGASNSNVRGGGGGGFAKNRYQKNRYKKNLVRSRSNLSLNQKTSNVRGGAAFNTRRGRGGSRFGLTRSRSRTNLTFNQGGFFTNNKNSPLLKRTSSLPNLRDPTSVHNRLGYQSPAQIAYRNRVKRAKQLLLQRRNQRLSLQNQLRMAQTGKALLSMQPRTLERRQQILTSQRRFTTGGLRSDQIARAQRRAQYEQKMQRMNTALLTPSPNVNFMCTLGNECTFSAGQRPLTLAQNQHTATIGSPRQIPRGRSPYRQNIKGLKMVFQSSYGSRTHNTATSDSGGEVDNRTFSEIMYNIREDFGVTGRTLNDRFSF